MLTRLTTCLLLLCFFVQYGQNNRTIDFQSLTLENQLDSMIKKSGRYETYKVVKRTWLDHLKKRLGDSLNHYTSELKSGKNKIAALETELSGLKSQLQASNIELEEFKTNGSKVSFLGMQFGSKKYVMALWIAIAVLCFGFFLFIWKNKNNSRLTKIAQERFANLEKEYDNHRKNALEREQKVRRQLQDELNKQKSN